MLGVMWSGRSLRRLPVGRVGGLRFLLSRFGKRLRVRAKKWTLGLVRGDGGVGSGVPLQTHLADGSMLSVWRRTPDPTATADKARHLRSVSSNYDGAGHFGPGPRREL